jgi:hypothetical protein
MPIELFVTIIFISIFRQLNPPQRCHVILSNFIDQEIAVSVFATSELSCLGEK